MNLSNLLTCSPMNNRIRLSDMPVFKEKPRTELDDLLLEMSEAVSYQIKFLNKKFGNFGMKKVIFKDVRGIQFPTGEIEILMPYFEMNPRLRYEFNNLTGEFYITKVKNRVLYKKVITDLSDVMGKGLEYEKVGVLTEKGFAYAVRNENLPCLYFNNSYSLKNDLATCMTNVMYKSIELD